MPEKGEKKMFSEKMLKDAIFAKGSAAVGDFVGMQLRTGITQAEMEDLFEQAYEQMPLDILAAFERKYLVTAPIDAKIVGRVLLQGHIRGYVLETASGDQFQAEMDEIVSAAKNGTLVLENATVARNSFGWDGLRGKKCSLSKLPTVSIDLDSDDGYCMSHMECIDCPNRGVKPICPEYIAAGDSRGKTASRRP